MTAFFALYALGSSDDPLLESYQNQFTPTLGFILFALFHITNITVLFSMLIAMLTTSYEAIQEHTDTEWKFSRARLYMDFIKKGSNLPIPFNILPSIINVFQFFYDLIRNRCEITTGDDDEQHDIESLHMKTGVFYLLIKIKLNR